MEDASAFPIRDLASQALLDGGSEAWATLGGAVERCIGEMRPGQVLQLISADHDARFDVPSWCRQAGHEFVATLCDTVESLFWIRKRE